jgi:hypothetical protein
MHLQASRRQNLKSHKLGEAGKDASQEIFPKNL